MPRHKVLLTDARGSRVRDLSAAEASAMIARGAAMEVDDGLCGRRTLRLVETHHAGQPISAADPCTITHGDIQAAYCGKGGRSAYERQRINLWPAVHDNLAPCVAGAR